MYLSDAHLKHKYVRKGLVLIGALKDKGNSIKKSFLDKSPKHKGKTCLIKDLHQTRGRSGVLR